MNKIYSSGSSFLPTRNIAAFSKNSRKQLSTETNPRKDPTFFSTSNIGSDNTSRAFIFSRHSPRVFESFAKTNEEEEEEAPEEPDFASSANAKVPALFGDVHL